MASSDDEAQARPQPSPLPVSNYYFVDGKDEPISFHVLPIQWSEGVRQDVKKLQIFLNGTTDKGLHKLFKNVIAWKFDLFNVDPEILVLSKDNNWHKLQKPRKSFEGIIRSILITVQSLHYVKRNPDTSIKSLWNHLYKVFSFYEVRPSQKDLVDHMPLISEAIKWDEGLAKSKLLINLLEAKPTRRNLYNEVIEATAKPGFIVDDVEDYVIHAEQESDDDDDNLFDSVCAFCDNGGQLLCCEGRCLRSFHATEEDGGDSNCESLGFTPDEVDAMQNFFCKNCEYKQHQCSACGKLGSSDKSSVAEVLPCVSATCGQFYHPHCIAKLIHTDNGVTAEELAEKISMGESFTCPIHKCCVCKQGENKKDPELRFAVCRRCPKSYHRKCLPREIVFEKTEEGTEEKEGEGEDEEEREEENIIVRAWEGLLPNRVLIYCMEHEIVRQIGTPMRNHINFPDTKEKKKQTNFEGKKRKQLTESLLDREESVMKKRNLSPEEVCRGKPVTVSKQKLKSSCTARVSGNRTCEEVPYGLDMSRKVKVNSSLKKEVKTVFPGGNKSSLGNKLFAYMEGSERLKSGKQGKPHGECKSAIVKNPSKTSSSKQPCIDAATERRLLGLMTEAASSITLEEVIKKHKVPSTHAMSSKNAVERNITLGKVEGSIEAIRTALQKLEEGCSIEDSQAVCAPEILKQIYKWKNKLKVYLAPLLHGMRYTSFGRHFTKVEKLEEIAERLHWYVKNGDMIVDFCCGANDFSIIMKKKLEDTGKNCSYKNYDFIQPKDDFNFEKRDWMRVKPTELPSGSQLIMGLNPPFGVKAALANKFINKALEFKPKILILIVPPETQRLNEKSSPYDLIWEDDQFLTGKSFYLPGSVDENDKQMDQWNVRPPPLYLWSRPDWSAEHNVIAQEHGHNFGSQDFMKGHIDSLIHEMPILKDNNSIKADSPKDIEGWAFVTKGHKESSYNNNNGGQQSSGYGKNYNDEILPVNKQDGVKVSGSEILEETLPHTGKGNQRLEPSNSGSSMEIETAYDGTLVNIADDPGKSFAMSSDERYSNLTHRRSTDASVGYGYRAASLEEPFGGHLTERSGSLGYRPYLAKVADPFWRESEIRSQVRLYGQQDPLPLRGNHLVDEVSVGGQIVPYSSSYSHGNFGSAAESSFQMDTSVMQLYAPRLDEFNHPMIGAFGSEPSLGYDPLMFSSSSAFDPSAPRPGQNAGSVGFAPGPHQSYSSQNSAGWLNE